MILESISAATAAAYNAAYAAAEAADLFEDCSIDQLGHNKIVCFPQFAWPDGVAESHYLGDELDED